MKQKDILEFWRNVEIFSLPNFPKQSSHKKPLDLNESLPWEKENTTTLRPNETIQYTLVFGKIEKKIISKHITNIIKTSDQKLCYDNNIDKFAGYSPIASLVLNEKGVPENNSYTLANYILGINIIEEGRDFADILKLINTAKSDHLSRYNDFINQREILIDTQNKLDSFINQKFSDNPLECNATNNSNFNYTDNIKRNLKITEENYYESKTSNKEYKLKTTINDNSRIINQEYIKTETSYLVATKLSNDNANSQEAPNNEYKIKPPKNTQEEVLVKTNPSDKKQGGAINKEYIKKEIAYLENITKNWLKDKIVIYCYVNKIKKNSTAEQVFFNSFYLDDLSTLCNLPFKNYSKTLIKYLGDSSYNDNRKDVLKEKEHLFKTIDPELMSAGRWPSSPNYGLYTAQLGAVNTILQNLESDNNCIQGINGPPGTGKTTLLLDVIAGIIVKRAEILVKIGCDNIFSHVKNKPIEIASKEYSTYNLNEKLQNKFSIVISSNNNSAVENISKELPSRSKIDINNFPNASYFSSCNGIDTVINGNKVYSNNFNKTTNVKSWGLISIPLGKAKNKSNFIENIWESNKKENTKGLKELLEKVIIEKTADQYKNKFNETKIEFKKQLNKFNKFKSMASKLHNLVNDYLQAKEKRDKIYLSVTKINSEIKQLHLQVAKLENLLITKPFLWFLKKLFKAASYKLWKKEICEILNITYKSISFSLETYIIKKYIQKANSKLKILEKEKIIHQSNISDLNNIIDEYQNLKDKLKAEYNIQDKNICDAQFKNLDLKDIHLRTPYFSPNILQLRSNIFLLSLQLHEYAILYNAKQMLANFNLFCVKLSVTKSVSKTLLQTLWDTFFLCIPVVSTTLASVNRLFDNMDTDQIAWLLLDEAGQASPQSAAGVLHRSRFCVAVGDPMQIEPIVSTPNELITALRNEKKIELVWSPVASSMQILSDRISLFGTYVPKFDNKAKKIWTGFPLRTHRRCANPMFSISNEIAYDKQMVKAVEDTSEVYSYVKPSRWIDVKGRSKNQGTHTVYEEIIQLKSEVKYLLENGYNNKIYVISLFTDVYKACEKELSEIDPYKKLLSYGTVHTFQGKETDIVFLVLGSNRDSYGVKQWASGGPNMLNVAVTRAKKYLYIIGDKELWSDLPYFNKAYACLE